jgi:acyl carrier protein
MDEIQERLQNCFQAVFPELSEDEILQADSNAVRSWDSVAGVTLLAVVEEEFGTSIETDDPGQFNSFESFVTYLRGALAR